MKRRIFWIGAVLATLFAAVLVFALWPTKTTPINVPVSADASQVERGRYIATVGDCTACHTKPGGREFAGGLPIASPIGTIYSTNITPNPATGIGKYTLTDFEHAVRRGIAPDGSTLYPAMPYPSFARLKDDDVAALYTYFMHGVQAVPAENHANEIRWPLSLRWPLAIWRKLFAPNPEGVADETSMYANTEIARGAYLVQGAGHCGSCHTPRAITLQEKALDDTDDAYLSGGQVIDGWVAVNLRGNSADGLGRWSKEDIVASLRDARNPTRTVLGEPMSNVVLHSTQYLNEYDLQAVAAYLKTLQPARENPSSYTEDATTGRELSAGVNKTRGAELYVDNCSACHAIDGKGRPRSLPQIAGNSSVLATNPASLIRLVLGGASLPSTNAAPSKLGMPNFDWRLSDDEAAQLLTFIRQSWGNHAPAVKESQVAQVRSSLEAERSGRMSNANFPDAHDPTSVEGSQQ